MFKIASELQCKWIFKLDLKAQNNFKYPIDIIGHQKWTGKFQKSLVLSTHLTMSLDQGQILEAFILVVNVSAHVHRPTDVSVEAPGHLLNPFLGWIGSFLFPPQMSLWST